MTEKPSATNLSIEQRNPDMANLTIDDYTKDTRINADLTRPGSPLNDFPFTDSLAEDAQFERDSSPVYTAGLFRTSRGPDRVQLSSFDPVTGAEQGGIYVFVDGLVTTAYQDGTIFFYDSTGTVEAYIQDQSGTLYMYGDAVEIVSGSDISIDANGNLISMNGSVEVTGYMVADGIVAGDHFGLTDGITAPSTIAGLGQIYIDTADGDLKIKFGDGTVKTIVTD